jgi:hypothetical protein
MAERPSMPPLDLPGLVLGLLLIALLLAFFVLIRT